MFNQVYGLTFPGLCFHILILIEKSVDIFVRFGLAGGIEEAPDLPQSTLQLLQPAPTVQGRKEAGRGGLHYLAVD